MNTKAPLCMTAVLVLLSLTACRDKSFDLNNVDLELTLGGNVSLPVGSFSEICLKDVLGLEGQDVITTDSNGDYLLSLKGSTGTEAIRLSDLSLDFQIDTVFSTGTVTMNIQVPTPAFQSRDYDFKTGKHFSYSTDKVPKEVAELGLCHLKNNSSLTFTFIESGLSSADAYIKAGCVFYMPEWIQLASLASDYYCLGDDGHSINFTHDMPVSRKGTVIRFDVDCIDFGKLPSSEGIHDGTIKISGDVGMQGQFFLKSEQLSPTGLASASIEASLVCGVCDLVDAEAKLDLATSIAPVSITVGSIPELSSEDTVLDLDDLHLLLSLRNSTPLNASLSALLSSWKNGHKVAEVRVGDNGSISSEAESVGNYCLSEKAWTTGSFKALTVPGLASLVREIPERFEISDIKVDQADEWVSYKPGKSYAFNLDYEASAPLAFGRNMHLSYDRDLEIGLDLSGDIKLREVDFDLEVSNTTPFFYTLETEACDAGGNVMEDVDITCTSVIAAGRTERPETTSVHIEACFSDRCKGIETLRLRFIAGIDDEHIGEAINEKQRICINNIVAKIVDGITIDLNKK